MIRSSGPALVAGIVSILLACAPVKAAQVIGVTYESPGDPIFTWAGSASPTACPYVIINAPNNGNLVSGDPQYIPTSSWSPSLAQWTSMTSTLHAHGIKVICYVDSAFTNRPVWQVENDMAQYLIDGFTVDGFFIDDVAWGWSSAAGDGSGTVGNWYTNLYNYVHSTMTTWNNSLFATSPTVIINPGGIGDVSSWMNACDIDVDFEGPYQTFTGVSGTVFNGYTSWSPSGTWVTSFPASRFLQVVTNVGSTSTVDTIFNGAAGKNAGYLFTTNLSCDWQAGINTYGTTPSQAIWNEEIFKGGGGGSTISNVTESLNSGKYKFSYNFTGTWSYFHVFLDTDRSASTGYTVAGIGADYMIENGTLYHATANGSGWNWASAGTVTYTNSGGVATFTVNATSLGSPTHLNAAYQVATSATSYTTGAFVY